MKLLNKVLLAVLFLAIPLQITQAQPDSERYQLAKQMHRQLDSRVPIRPAGKTKASVMQVAAKQVASRETPIDLIFYTSEGTLLLGSEDLLTRLEWGAPAEDLESVLTRYVETVREEDGILYGEGVSGVFRSIDDGKTWEQVFDEFTVSLSSSSTTLATGGFSGEVWLSDDKGDTWRMINAVDTADVFFARGIAVVGDVIAYRAFTDPFRVSSDQGETWAQPGINGSFLWSNLGHMYTDDLSLSGMLSRSAGGTDWDVYSSHNLFLVQRFFEDERVRIVNSSDELEYQEVGGNWYSFTEAIGGETVNTFAVDPDGYLWMGTEEGSIHRSSSPITTVSGTSAENVLPATIALHPAYPNPFNPSTTIPFEIRTSGRVQITAFDVLGREVATILDETFPPGRHEMTWDADSLPGGVYLIRMQTSGGVVRNRTAVLLK